MILIVVLVEMRRKTSITSLLLPPLFARGVWSCLLNCPTSIDGNNLIQWFKTMFLSNNDDYTSMEKCLLAGLGGQKLIIGFSDNFYRILQKS